MLSHVVVGTDFSKPSEAVLDYLPRLKYAGLEKVTLVHVESLLNMPGYAPTILAAAREALSGEVERLRESGFEVEPALEHGSAAIKLADVAKEHDADAIVVGSHGRSLLGRILLGSTSMSLLHQSTVPVLIVRVALCETDEGISCELQSDRPSQHILFPTDFSDAANAAFEQMKALVGETASRVTLLHVHNPPAYPEDDDDVDEEDTLPTERRVRLERMVERLRSSGLSEIETVVTTGVPAVSIVKHAHERDVSMIAMGTQGRGAMQELMVGSTALKVSRTSTVPVLMIPHRP